MRCQQCQGVMRVWMRGWRCRDCGYAIDPLREANRRLHQAIGLMEESSRLHDDGGARRPSREVRWRVF